MAGRQALKPGGRYDLVLDDGRHLLDVPVDPSLSNIQHALRLRPWHRLPYLGIILRNFWAKQHGARLFQTIE